MSKIGHKAMMAADRPEIAAVKARLKALERLRAEGVVLGRVNNVFSADSWAIPDDYGVSPVSGEPMSRGSLSVRQPGRTPLIGLCVPAAEPHQGEEAAK